MTPPRIHRADILQYNPDGTAFRIYASGIRNAVGLAIDPNTGSSGPPSTSAMRLGDNRPARLHHPHRRQRLLRLALVLHRQPPGPAPCRAHTRTGRQSHRPRRPDPGPLRFPLHDLLHRHPIPRPISAALPSPPSTAPGTAPAEPATKSSASPSKNGKSDGGEYDDFLTGFVTDAGDGAAPSASPSIAGLAHLTDDGSNSIWRVRYTAK